MIIIRELEDILGNLLNFCVHGTAVFVFSNRVFNRWNQLDQRAVGASSINAFKGCLSKKGKQGWASSWTNPPSPGPPWWVFWLVRPHKDVSSKVSNCIHTFPYVQRVLFNTALLEDVWYCLSQFKKLILL